MELPERREDDPRKVHVLGDRWYEVTKSVGGRCGPLKGDQPKGVSSTIRYIITIEKEKSMLFQLNGN